VFSLFVENRFFPDERHSGIALKQQTGYGGLLVD
jgi:hypothetical protein